MNNPNNIDNDHSMPPSATHPLVAWIGCFGFVGALWVGYQFKPEGFDYSNVVLFITVITAAALFGADMAFGGLLKRHSRFESDRLTADRQTSQSDAGIREHVNAHAVEEVHSDHRVRKASRGRVTTKFIGLIATLVLLGIVYAVLPEYHAESYFPFYELMLRVIPVWLILAVPYFYVVDGKMTDPYDGYWHMGQAVMLEFDEVDKGILKQYLLGWLIKGFFLPLMLTFFRQDVVHLYANEFHPFNSFKDFFDFSYDFLYLIDVGLVSVGYLFALRITDTHFRSAEPTVSGWVAAIVCYPPIWPFIAQHYIVYDSNYYWGQWLSPYPILYVLWGSAILVLVFVYVWSTIAFGARFSNLTHRGIITSGPYRYLKHPAYFSKNLSWWLISIPFIVHENCFQTIAHCLMLLMLNGIYYARAKTEERHLLNDPVYQQYCESLKRSWV